MFSFEIDGDLANTLHDYIVYAEQLGWQVKYTTNQARALVLQNKGRTSVVTQFEQISSRRASTLVLTFTIFN